MRPNTTVVYTESPGSDTFEVQDIPAIARAAHAGGARLLMDNTWGIHHFQPFQHGVDVSIQAATKYPAGHSDVLIGTVTVNNDDDWNTLHATARGLGQYASPDDCWLTLRGMRTLAIRLQAQMEAAIHVGHWLRQQPEVAQVLNSALPGALGMSCGSVTSAARAVCSVSSSGRNSRSPARTNSLRRSSCLVSVHPGAATKVLRFRPLASSPVLPGRGDSRDRWSGCTSDWRMSTI